MKGKPDKALDKQEKEYRLKEPIGVVVTMSKEAGVYLKTKEQDITIENLGKRSWGTPDLAIENWLIVSTNLCAINRALAVFLAHNEVIHVCMWKDIDYLREEYKGDEKKEE